MILTETCLTEIELEENGYRDRLSLKIETLDETLSLRFFEGEPEDASLSRDYSDCYSIKQAILIAYNAGKKGEELIIK